MEVLLLIKSCEICDKFKELKETNNVGSCQFSSEIPYELKEEFALYCDFFNLQTNKD